MKTFALSRLKPVRNRRKWANFLIRNCKKCNALTPKCMKIPHMWTFLFKRRKYNFHYFITTQYLIKSLLSKVVSRSRRTWCDTERLWRRFYSLFIQPSLALHSSLLWLPSCHSMPSVASLGFWHYWVSKKIISCIAAVVSIVWRESRGGHGKSFRRILRNGEGGGCWGRRDLPERLSIIYLGPLHAIGITVPLGTSSKAFSCHS